MSDKRQVVAESFDNLEQQHHAASLGMWIFLATEVLFFGALFLGYIVYRTLYGEAFREGSQHMDLLLGTINTAALITSSLTMALAVHAAKVNQRFQTRALLGATALLGLLFLGIKGYEYHHHYTHQLVPGLTFHLENASAEHGGEIFFTLYFFMTGLHAIHLAVGIGVVLVLILMIPLKSAARAHLVELTGLYWHFVDVVWVFLFPLFYLIR